VKTTKLETMEAIRARLARIEVGQEDFFDHGEIGSEDQQVSVVRNADGYHVFATLSADAGPGAPREVYFSGNDLYATLEEAAHALGSL